MNSKGLTVAAALLAILSGIIWWSNKKQTETAKSPSPDAAPKILSFNQPDAVRLSIERLGGARVDMTKNGAEWQITAPDKMTADSEAVSSVLSTLASLNSDRLLEEKATDLSQYGLASPALEIDVALKDNKTDKLLIGDQTPGGSAYYARVDGDPRVFTLAGYNKTSLDKTADDLRDKRLLTADFDKVSQLELINDKAGKQDLVFARDKDSWQIVKPAPYRADAEQVERLIRSLRNAKIETSAATDQAKLTADFKAAVPLATAKVTGAQGVQELEVRKAKDVYYAKSSVLPEASKVAADVGTALDKSLDDFRNKKIFDFGFQDPDKIELHDGPKAYFLTRSGSDWWDANGKKLDAGGAQELVSKLRDLAATKLPESGFTAPVLEITITSNGGKRVEKVLVAQSKDGFVAKRANESSLYELSASAVQDLQKAASVKPATSPEVKK